MNNYSIHNRSLARNAESVARGIYQLIRIMVEGSLRPAMIIAAFVTIGILIFGLRPEDVRHAMAYLLASTDSSDWQAAWHITATTYRLAAVTVMFYLFLHLGFVQRAIVSVGRLIFGPLKSPLKRLAGYFRSLAPEEAEPVNKVAAILMLIASICTFFVALQLLNGDDASPARKLDADDIKAFEARIKEVERKTPVESKPVAVILLPDGTMHSGTANVEVRDGQYVVAFDKVKGK